MRPVFSPRTVRSLTGFAVELLVITVGLLIALAIDNWVEAREHQQLVDEARRGLKAEISRNARDADEAIQELTRLAQQLQANLDALAPFQSARAPQDDSHLVLNFDFQRSMLSDTSWNTARATGALSYLPYDEAQIYSQIYSLQSEFHSEQARLAEDAAQLVGLALQQRNDDSLLAPAEASQVARHLGVARSHVLIAMGWARAVSDLQRAFLEGRTGTTFSINARSDLSIGSNAEPDAKPQEKDSAQK